MSYKALYRKWRPLDFDAVRGQDAVITALKNQVISGRIGHAYLFCGTRGTGKTSVAKILSRAVNCPHAAEHGGNPCNACEVCREIAENRSMNVLEIDAASNNGVDNVREIREQVEYPPTSGRYRIYIIDEVHMLSTGAFNALLKTLEEPPEYVIFILATTDPQKIPQTILSRCQRYDFRRMSLQTLTGQLTEICQKEQLAAEPEALEEVARSAEGSMRDALSLLDQCRAFSGEGTLTCRMVQDILGTADRQSLSGLYRNIIESRTEEALEVIDRLIREGRDESRLIRDMIWHLRNVLLAGSSAGGSILEASEEEMKELQAEYRLADRSRLLEILSALAELSNRCRFAPQKRVLLEVEIIRLCLGEHAYGQCCEAASREPGTRQAGSIHQESIARQESAARQESVMRQESIARPESGGPPDVAAVRRMLEGRSNPAANREPVIPMSPNITIPAGVFREEPSNRAAAERTPAEERTTAAERTPSAAEEHPAEEKRPAAENQGTVTGASENDNIGFLREHWKKLIEGLDPTNRSVYADVEIRMEQQYIRLIFRSMINYRIAAKNTTENGLKKIEEICFREYGRQLHLTARAAAPGELKEKERPDISELSRINFPVEIID